MSPLFTETAPRFGDGTFSFGKLLNGTARLDCRPEGLNSRTRTKAGACLCCGVRQLRCLKRLLPGLRRPDSRPALWQAAGLHFFPPALRQMQYWCTLIDEHTPFPVDLVETATVHQLKEEIAKNQDLKDLATGVLTLYPVELDESCDEKKRINELERLYQHLNECTALGVEKSLSVYFDGSNSPERNTLPSCGFPRVSPCIVEALSLWLMVLMPKSKSSRTQAKTIGD